MGRPKGEGARAKSRPSSSSLAASLSQGSVSLNAGFGGYVGSTRIDAGPSEDALQNIDGELAANLRRLTKKDPITKLKALSGLTSYFQEHSAAEVASLIPCWVFEYKKLVQDNNRQVRESTHKAMSSLATTVGRSLAPHLRSVMGAWWMSHFDPFYEVSDAAKQALQVAFPGQKKRLEALSFCASDILTYMDENLKLTPQTISDKTTPVEEATEKYERVISSTLLALSALLNITSTSEQLAASNIVSASIQLFNDHKMFQGLMKSSSFRVRAAVYEVLKAYIQYVPQVISNDNMDAATKVILGAFVEKDSSCHQAMWDMILVFSHRFGQAWDAKKIVHQRFWAFLRHGCYGSQKISYPCLLPLLSVIPPSALAPARDFFLEFFTNLWRGREEGSWTSDEGFLLLNVVKECFMWLIEHEERYSSKEGFETGALSKFLVESVLFGLLWRTYMHDVAEKKQLLLREEVGTCIAGIINLLDDQLLSSFWPLLREDCSASLHMNKAENNARLLQFFSTLKRTPINGKRAQILNNVVKPLVAEGFSYVKLTEEPEAVKLFANLVSAYGSTVFDLLASVSWKGDNYSETKDELKEHAAEVADVFSSKQLQYLFRNELLPWSVSGSNELKIHFLLAFLEDQTFSKEWDYVLDLLSESEDSVFSSTLAILIKALQGTGEQNAVYQLGRWRSSKIDQKVLTIACSSSKLLESPCDDLLRISLKGIYHEGTYHFILAEESMLAVVKELLRTMSSAVYLSKNRETILLVTSIAAWVSKESESSTLTIEEARAAADILLSCSPSLAFLEESSGLLSTFLATVFCLYWTFVLPLALDIEDDEENETYGAAVTGDDAGLVKLLFQAHQNMASLCRELPSCNSLQKMLITGVKKVVSENPSSENAAAWLLDCLKLTCFNDDDMQKAMDFLLAKSDYWPFWTTATTSSEPLQLQVQKHNSFSSVIYKIGCSLGPETLFLRGSDGRPWLILELLYTWEWTGGSAEVFVLPFLQLCAASDAGSCYRTLLGNVVETLFHEAANSATKSSITLDDPYLRALVGVLRALFDHGGPSGREEGEKLFFDFVSNLESTPAFPLSILPYVLDVLMPTLAKGTTAGMDVESSVCSWLTAALNAPSLYSPSSADSTQWMQVAVACFPMDPSGGMTALCAASKSNISQTRKNLLLFILRKQIYAASGAEGKSERSIQLILSKLLAAAVCYCWESFGAEEWIFVIGNTKEWIEDGVVNAEEVTEAVAEVISEEREVEVANDFDEVSAKLIGTALNIFSLMQAFKSLDKAAGTAALQSLEESSSWPTFEARATENVLRVLLATGLTESLLSDSETGRQKLAMRESFLWDRVADIALSSSTRVREASVRAADLWGVGKSAVSALYSLLFSTHPLPSLQWVSYNFLSTGPLQHQAVSWKPVNSSANAEEEQSDLELKMDAVFDGIRPELLSKLSTPASMLSQSELSSTCRSHYFLAWAIFLSHLRTLQTASQMKEHLLQYVRDSDIASTLLDCLVQHIPLKKSTGSSAEKKSVTEISPVAEAARRSSSTGSLLFAAEDLLWAGNASDLGVIAGALYGLLLRVLPACVQTWFTGLRDRGAASAIEAFTTEHCSPYLLSEEFNQVQASAIADENLTIKAARSLREVTAIYKKEEAGMEIVMKMPSCYPLKAVEADCRKRMGISETVTRKWILSIGAFLRNQNGSLSEAVLIWKRNVDREFEGVEECPICYSITHTSNHSLPRLACKTCRHKFHGACLYKWFSSSHKSTCPLCQTPF